MAFHDDLLKQAFDLARNNAQAPTQADLRRCVSSAYYAIFHLLISETTMHWNLDESRAGLARMFEHSVMKKASLRVADANIFPFAGEDPQVVALLRQVGRAFSRLQDKRHVADYDTATDWVQTEALSEVETAEKAFSAWQAIRHTKIARDYLVSLLIKPRG